MSGLGLNRPKPPGPGEFADLEDDPPEIDPTKVYVPGAITKDILPRLKMLVELYSKDDEKARTLGFLGWVPPEHLERFLVLALEYAQNKTWPKGVERRRTRRGRTPEGEAQRP